MENKETISIINGQTKQWDHVEKLIDILNKAKNDKWNWISNSRCKHITINIDMRGHGINILDRDGYQIGIDQLLHQAEDKSSKPIKPNSLASRIIQKNFSLFGKK